VTTITAELAETAEKNGSACSAISAFNVVEFGALGFRLWALVQPNARSLRLKAGS